MAFPRSVACKQRLFFRIFSVSVWVVAAISGCSTERRDHPQFETIQPHLFAAGKALTNAFADYDNDGDLDLFVGFNGESNRLYRNDEGTYTNMDGDANGFFQNDGNRFVDVASRLGLESGGRAPGDAAAGSVRPGLGDYDNDGDLDIFVANYSPNALFRNRDGQFFENVASPLGLAIR